MNDRRRRLMLEMFISDPAVVDGIEGTSCGEAVREL